MRSADGIRYNVLVPRTCAKALLEESIMLGQLAEEGGDGEEVSSNAASHKIKRVTSPYNAKQLQKEVSS